MKHVIAALALVGLVGCAQPRVVSSSDMSVAVRAGADVARAQSLADAECAKSARKARLAARPNPMNPDFVFDCVQ